MKLVFTLIVSILSVVASAQSFAEQHYQFDVNYKMMQGYYNRGLYQEATQYIDSLKDNRYVNGQDYYFFARIYSLNNEFDKSLFYLEKAVKRGITKADVEKMYDLDKFKESHLNIVFELNYDKWHQEYLENPSKSELDSIYINEISKIREKALIIRYKTVVSEDGDEIYELHDSPDIYLKAKKQDSINFYDLTELIIERGFPTVRVVGIKGLWDVTTILESYITYYNSSPQWEKVKKIISEEINTQHVKPFFLGRLEDLYRFRTNQPIKYSTRISFYRQVQNEVGEYVVERPEELNIRRKSIGLCPIQVEVWSNAMELPLSLQEIKFK